MAKQLTGMNKDVMQYIEETFKSDKLLTFGFGLNDFLWFFRLIAILFLVCSIIHIPLFLRYSKAAEDKDSRTVLAYSVGSLG